MLKGKASSLLVNLLSEHYYHHYKKTEQACNKFIFKAVKGIFKRQIFPTNESTN